jgi:hypothetical protein
MTDTADIQPGWVIPGDLSDMAPLPALLDRLTCETALYSRRGRIFGEFGRPAGRVYPAFEDCRAAMMQARAEALREAREQARTLAAQIEHIRTIPSASFPDVIREVPEARSEEVGQKEAGQEKAEPEEVT